jgi:four helix bundle protein
MQQFDHERLEVYQASIRFVALANEVVQQLPRGRGYLGDQLQRASTSIALNIAEGAGEHSGPDKARFYQMARRSATECAAILDVCRQLELISRERYDAGRELLLRCVSMLIKLGRSVVSGTGTGTGTGT